MSDEPNVEQGPEQLVHLAADRAARLALVGAEKAQTLAVAQAVRDALVDRTLLEHSTHLEQVNGSQRAMANSLVEVDRKVDGLVTLAEANAAQHRWALKRWQMWTAALGVIAAYGSILAIVLGNN